MEIDRIDKRLFKVETNGKIMNTPFFFPAISSIKTNLRIEEYIKIVQKIGYQGFLVSSYDLYNAGEKDKKPLLDLISGFTDGETITLLDSGYYEAFWYRDDKWIFQNLASILDEISVDFCFSFDVFWDNKNIEQYARESITTIAKTAGMQKIGTTIPLLHSNPESFPQVVRKVVEGINPQVIGVPERELGSSIFERATTVKNIRDELDKTNRQVPLHLLGTGNPISILIYTLCGADIYDGLEWCQTVVNPKTAHLFHFVQRDLIDCDCRACKLKKVDYTTQTIAHNLLFYRSFMETIRISIEENRVEELLKKHLSPKNSEKVKEIMGSK